MEPIITSAAPVDDPRAVAAVYALIFSTQWYFWQPLPSELPSAARPSRFGFRH